MVLCCHVIYTIQEVEAFVRKLGTHAKDKVLAVLYQAAPQSRNYPLWAKVHAEERLALPSLSEFQEVLAELGIKAKVEGLGPQPRQGFDSLEQALQQLGSRLYVAADSPKMRLLENALEEFLEEEDGVFYVRGSKPLEPHLVSWQPDD